MRLQWIAFVGVLALSRVACAQIEVGAGGGVVVPVGRFDRFQEPGYAIETRGGYRIIAGAFAVVPGVRFVRDAPGAKAHGEEGELRTTIWQALAELRAVVPIGRVEPYVDAAVGVGHFAWDQTPGGGSSDRLAYAGGAGFDLRVTSVPSVGAYTRYEHSPLDEAIRGTLLSIGVGISVTPIR